MTNKLRTLILDDDPVYLKLASQRLEEDFVVFTALCPTDAFDLLSNERIDVLICDYSLPEMDGVEVVKAVKTLHPGTDVIMISGGIEEQHIVDAFDSGVIDFLQKPFDYTTLKISIERAKNFVSLKKKSKKMERYNSFLTRKLNEQDSFGLIYCSESMQYMQSQMEELAKDDSISVFITGEIGLYKDSIARRIHNLSCRSNKHFAAINTAAVTDAMFETKFFGYDKAVVKGTRKDELGWFEIAKGGTLFFDEIADLSIYQQGKLNSVLQNKKYAKIGSRKKMDVDVRLITACSVDLEVLKANNTLRSDLLQKLNGYNLNIPPLRDRQEDIPLLMNYFIRHFSKKMRKIIHGFDVFAEQKLMEYSFPGNTQELSNLIERAVILCEGDTLNLDHFPSVIAEKDERVAVINSFDLGLIERDIIVRALIECDYNKTKAAKLLNLNWNALHRRLQKFKIVIPEGVG
ncbi:sigma-54-dependent Fis family transcriptional regulator [Ancylomarina salipaludis]|uniref:Sigma-54-dependent Fis family transcriptional regulator n=1 Tax=Ancylomarina salipaludis TaxID=2501299 RepID=A0A4Q1JJ49_9BACT|nr:sigma-54 dependent transcriptional regulator [Ancylomarina salipaludis]RXQ88124.1 sigma-54-dependent Fis family transcriptional regulator [Ancylomarina salipaludis]